MNHSNSPAHLDRGMGHTVGAPQRASGQKNDAQGSRKTGFELS